LENIQNIPPGRKSKNTIVQVYVTWKTATHSQEYLYCVEDQPMCVSCTKIYLW